MKTKIVRRETINNDIMKELQKKYPVQSEKGICYEQKMDYITMDIEIFNNAVFRQLVRKNIKVLMVYIFLRERMCHKGWYMPWDDTDKIDVTERLALWGISDEDECSAIIDLLLKEKVIYKFQNGELEYITDVQQIYNWEMLQARRKRDRESKSGNKSATDTSANSQEYYPSEEQNYMQQEQYPPQEQYMQQEQYPPQGQSYPNFDNNNQYQYQEQYMQQEQLYSNYDNNNQYQGQSYSNQQGFENNNPFEDLPFN